MKRVGTPPQTKHARRLLAASIVVALSTVAVSWAIPVAVVLLVTTSVWITRSQPWAVRRYLFASITALAVSLALVGSIGLAFARMTA